LLTFSGFASFCFIIGFLLLVSGAIYYGPLLYGGSVIEKRILRVPFDIENEAAAATGTSESVGQQ